MKKAEKRQAEEFVKLLGQAHDEIRKSIEKSDSVAAMELLEQCQDGAIQLGNLIEKTEGEGFVTVPLIEEYCELVYQIHERLASGEVAEGKPIYRKLRKSLIQVENSVKNDIKARLEIVFFPYKASMWDSLESVWRAADADPDCDAYVVPIPYYDRKPDRSFGEKHYEGNQYPMDVPVIWYEDYNLEERKPDIAYIHNPYDEYNYVTSVDPRYYSYELKKNVGCLVYIPYYATPGGWGWSKKFCSAYQYADYIVVQAEKYVNFLDQSISREKILPLGSPKFDRAIHMCASPEKPPKAWQDRMRGRKVYLYNTSIGSMLADTGRFLEKMMYVFLCFQGRNDVCLVWRPHPLLESTFLSMRPEVYLIYQELKKKFLEEEIGIYDDTPDMTKTLSLCDAYVGEGNSSVVTLFGVTEKPIFATVRAICENPKEDDWKGGLLQRYFQRGTIGWLITPGNELYQWKEEEMASRYVCKLSNYAYAGYYRQVLSVGDVAYVCPGDAQEIPVIQEGKLKYTVFLKRQMEQPNAFAGAVMVDKMLYLLPWRYPSLVKYNTEKDKVSYLENDNRFWAQEISGEWRFGGSCSWKNYLLLASPSDSRVMILDSRTDRMQILRLNTKNTEGCLAIIADEDEVWLLPYKGDIITKWNPETGQLQDYSGLPEGFACGHHSFEKGMMKPFSSALFCGNLVYFAPFWGNMFVRLDLKTGTMEQWQSPFPMMEKEKSGYFVTDDKKMEFYTYLDDSGKKRYICHSYLDGKRYELDLETERSWELPFPICMEELKRIEPGFTEQDEWFQYACKESAFVSLKDFLDETIAGKPFDRLRQRKAYGKINASPDGNCGKSVHQFLKEKCCEQEWTDGGGRRERW